MNLLLYSLNFIPIGFSCIFFCKFPYTFQCFIRKPSRIWLNQFLWEKDKDPDIQDFRTIENFQAVTSTAKGGCFSDTLRFLYPDKTEAYTNWCSLTGARATNYGRRLDYIFTSLELVEDAEDCIVMAEIEGSDHCPCKASFGGNFIPASKCPSLCSKFMPEFLGTQQKLSSFFVKRSDSNPEPLNSNKIPVVSDGDDGFSSSQEENKKVISAFPKAGFKRENSNSGTLPSAKRKKQEQSGISKQASLKNFFSIPKGSNSESKSNSKDSALKMKRSFANGETTHVSECQTVKSDQEIQPDSGKGKSSALAWKQLLKGPPTAPLCKGHNEQCVLRTVKKDGPNKGKQFFVCNRPEGHSSNPNSRCDFFLWVDKMKSDGKAKN